MRPLAGIWFSLAAAAALVVQFFKLFTLSRLQSLASAPNFAGLKSHQHNCKRNFLFFISGGSSSSGVCVAAAIYWLAPSRKQQYKLLSARLLLLFELSARFGRPQRQLEVCGGRLEVGWAPQRSIILLPSVAVVCRGLSLCPRFALPVGLSVFSSLMK